MSGSPEDPTEKTHGTFQLAQLVPGARRSARRGAACGNKKTSNESEMVETEVTSVEVFFDQMIPF